MKEIKIIDHTATLPWETIQLRDWSPDSPIEKIWKEFEKLADQGCILLTWPYNEPIQ